MNLHLQKEALYAEIGTKPYILMNQFYNYSEECYYDEELDWGIWIHK